MEIVIRPVAAADIEGLNRALNAICGERRFLMRVDGFSVESSRDFVREILDNGWPQMVALDGNRVVGWCDIIPGTAEGFRHVGRLGMGLLRPYRGSGVGRRLLEACLRAARELPLEKVELDVFSDNDPAIRLYERVGFVLEGRRRQSRKLDGRYQDMLCMGLQL